MGTRAGWVGGAGQDKGPQCCLGRWEEGNFWSLLKFDREGNSSRVSSGFFLFILKNNNWLTPQEGQSISLESARWAIKYFSLDIRGTEAILRRLSFRRIYRFLDMHVSRISYWSRHFREPWQATKQNERRQFGAQPPPQSLFVSKVPSCISTAETTRKKKKHISTFILLNHLRQRRLLIQEQRERLCRPPEATTDLIHRRRSRGFNCRFVRRAQCHFEWEKPSDAWNKQKGELRYGLSFSVIRSQWGVAAGRNRTPSSGKKTKLLLLFLSNLSTDLKLNVCYWKLCACNSLRYTYNLKIWSISHEVISPLWDKYRSFSSL